MANISSQKFLVHVVRSPCWGGVTKEVIADSPIGAARSVLCACDIRHPFEDIFLTVIHVGTSEVILNSDTQPEVFDGLP